MFTKPVQRVGVVRRRSKPTDPFQQLDLRVPQDLRLFHNQKGLLGEALRF